MDGPDVQQRLREDQDEANQRGVKGSPAVFIEAGN